MIKRRQHEVEVSCYSGYRGEETPRSFVWNERRITIDEIVDRWLDPEHRYFKVRGDDGGVYILRHDPNSGAWEMSVVMSGGPSEP